MYLRRVILENLRCISRYSMVFQPEEFAGWHVVIGDNGSGKTTLVKAIALAFAGPSEPAALREDWRNWLRIGEKTGRITATVDFDPKVDKSTGKGTPVKRYYVPMALALIRNGSKVELVDRSENLKPKPYRYVWGEGSGWFSASYGPFRRFTGGNKEYEKLYYAFPRLAPHLSAFGEDVALTECLTWLQQLHFKRLEGKPEGDILEDVFRFVNEGGLLPHNTFLKEVSSDSVVFQDGNNCEVPVDQLSDGYRSILSMTFELIRQMILAFGQKKVFANVREGDMRIDVPGVVLVDEIDAHLHPTWQRRIGIWFRRCFPSIQFIVTTHSPLICQAAEIGTVWRLPTPGSGPADAKRFGRIRGPELKRLMYGSILEAFDTQLFGEDISRSDLSKEKLARLAALNRKQLRGDLSDAEEEERRELRQALPTAATMVEEA